MLRTFSYSIALLSIITLTSGRVLAASEGHDHGSHPQAGHAGAEKAERVGDVYPLAADPLGESLADVEEPVVILHDGRELHFASEANAEQFRADPQKYLATVDQLIIEQQTASYPLNTCVVSGQKLGEMGEPIDYLYGNRLVRFCCKGCVGEFTKDPDSYLAKINDAVIEAQRADYPLETCVVSSDKLGGEMGDPIDYVIGNRLVRFCCKMCIKEFEANPARYLNKLEDHAEHQDGEHDMHADEAHAGHHGEETEGDNAAGQGHHEHGEHH